MNYFLAKTEPQVYSIDDLESEKTTVWDGIKNAQALAALRAMRPGDRVFIYHSGDGAAVAGLAEVASAPRPDPKDAKLSVVDLRYLMHLKPPTPLGDIKSSGLFDDWALVRQGRLSTMSAPREFVDWLRKRYPGVRI
ncbi:MAG TPA: EVE domain-containing protein [Bryobacteraceae bacterium]|nr:EVE domain-containing protein [Bryobacteraceae bacterium]